MKEIPLTQGKVALVDDEDYDYLMQWRWFTDNSNGRFYAVRTDSPDIFGKRARIRMHREILKMNKDDKRETDHINHNGLDNRKFNLRPCLKKDNQHNGSIPSHNTSGYKGVSFLKNGYNKCWRATIVLNKKQIYLGSFLEKEEAARAYDIAAKYNYGEFSCTNF